MTQREKYIAAGVGAAAILFVLNQLVINPYFEKKNDLETKTLAAVRVKSDGTDLIDRHPRMVKSWDVITDGGLSTDFSQASRKARGEVDEWIRESGVSMNQVNSDRITDAKPFQVISFTVDVSGSTPAMMKFLQFFEKSKAPVRIVDMTVSPTTPGTDILRIKLNISTLSLKPEIPGSPDSVSSASGVSSNSSCDACVAFSDSRATHLQEDQSWKQI